MQGAQAATITNNEIRTALNKPEDSILAVAVIDGSRRTCIASNALSA